MKISIIVPVYNVEQYIKECFDSIAAQTYKGDIECIFVDDCGQDKSVEILENMIADYQGGISFSIIHHEHNKGLSGARNTGINHATGDYLYFLDSDDSIIPNTIESMVKKIVKYPNAQIVIGGVNVKSSKFGWADITKKNLPEYSIDKKWIKCSFLKKAVFGVTAWNKLISRSFLLKNNLFFKEGVIHEDEHWNYFLAKKVDRLAICNINTYNYIIRPNSITSRKTQKDIDSYKIIYKDFVENIDEFCKQEQVDLIYDFIRNLIFYEDCGTNKNFFLKILSELVPYLSYSKKIKALVYIHMNFLIRFLK